MERQVGAGTAPEVEHGRGRPPECVGDRYAVLHGGVPECRLVRVLDRT